MAEPFLGEIRLFAFSFAPHGWAFCAGQLIPINQNQALFALLGNTYGGDGRVTFALPDLQGRAPVHVADSLGYPQGAVGGESTHTLTVSEMPSHTHAVAARAIASTGLPAGALWARWSQAAFASTPNVTMAQSALGSTGGGQPHDNMPPYLVMSYAIATVGIFPSRN
jgi:microcystin-dependent protein